MRTFKTKAGTELPLLDLRGKDYLQVAHRLVWMREEHPDWGIETGIELNADRTMTLATAYIRDATGRLLATAHKVEDQKGFPDHVEKAETGAVGRALAMCGYGTQFAPELEEGDRLADAPLPPAAKKAVSKPTQTAATQPTVIVPRKPVIDLAPPWTTEDIPF